MARRQKVPRRTLKKVFRRGKRVHKKNFPIPMMRGGMRL